MKFYMEVHLSVHNFLVKFYTEVDVSGGGKHLSEGILKISTRLLQEG